MHFVSAIERRFPSWQERLGLKDGEEPLVISNIKEFLRTQAFDEANAEMMLTLPSHERPKDRYSAFEWICAELARREMKEELEFARCDNVRCGEAALEIFERLEQAANGATVKSAGMHVASYIRNNAMSQFAELQQSLVCP